MALRRRTPAAPEPPAVPEAPPKPGGKGRPTPKRREAQKRRAEALAPPPASRREAAQRSRIEARARRLKVREGLARGDERFLPRRDAGPVRALVRDLVDSRRSAGVLLLPSALIVFVGQILPSDRFRAGAFLLWLLVIAVMFTDWVLLAAVIARTVRSRFPDRTQRTGRMGGLLFYGVTRSTVFRRWRLPKPQVSVGDRV